MHVIVLVIVIGRFSGRRWLTPEFIVADFSACLGNEEACSITVMPRSCRAEMASLAVSLIGSGFACLRRGSGFEQFSRIQPVE